MSQSFVLRFKVRGLGWDVLKAGKPVARISRCADADTAQALGGYRGYTWFCGPYVTKWATRNQMVRGSVRGWVELQDGR
jgi:hypothetical protein